MIHVKQDSGHTIHASHIEKPITKFFVEFDSAAYKNVLYFEDSKRWLTVLAETPEGAIFVAKFHYSSRGRNFKLIESAHNLSTT